MESQYRLNNLCLDSVRFAISSVPIWQIVTSGNIDASQTRKEVHYITPVLLKIG